MGWGPSGIENDPFIGISFIGFLFSVYVLGFMTCLIIVPKLLEHYCLRKCPVRPLHKLDICKEDLILTDGSYSTENWNRNNNNL